LLDDAEVAAVAAKALKKTLLMFDFFHDVALKASAGNAQAKEVMQSWADAQWFTERPEVPRKITVTVFKVPGETNTDDLSPAPDAWSRPDIPLHYLSMLKNTREGAAFKPEEESKRGPMKFIDELKANFIKKEEEHIKTIEVMQQEIETHENEIRELKKKIPKKRRKHFIN
jgi:aconitate hydratase 2/2-methylisocitrate dehydratase